MTGLDLFDPAVAGWFASRFDAPTEPQRRAWPIIRAGRDVLVTAPTGSGKTLAAFLSAIDRLATEARAGTLRDETRVVYVSPLKALSADIRENLEDPLAGIAARGLAGIRAALRTGDTPARDRARMTRKPPHLLVTTPESLFLLLTSERGRDMLGTVRTVIVDEIHALAGDKRGSHLALSLLRLERVTGRPPQRIGLSATVRPLDSAARFLSSRDPEIVPIGHQREMRLRVATPGLELGAVATHEVMEDIRDRIADLIRKRRTTLVFVNTRRMAERFTHDLEARLGPGMVLAHHGSLARDVRLDAERRLREGGLRAMVATASLELGIDIGTVDLVCQLGAPRAIGTALQRIGRSGHGVGAVSEGWLFPVTRDELAQCAAVVRAIRAGELDRTRIPEAPLDILAQQLVAELGAVPDRSERLDDLFDLVRSAWPYRNLSRAAFDDLIAMLADGVATARGRRGALLHLDRVHRTARARRGARLAAIQGGGAIPETAEYRVVVEPDDRVVGSVDEDFAIESSRGMVFQLGTAAWRVRRITGGDLRVEDAAGAPPTIPFWLGEAPGRTRELSEAVSDLRTRLDGMDRAAAEALLVGEAGLDASGADQAIRYLAAGRAALGAMPSSTTVVAERFFDESGGMQLVLHAPFGIRVNRAWGLALRKRFCRSFNLELQAAATDDGLNIALTDLHSFPLESVFGFLNPENVEATLTQAMLGYPLFNVRFRHNATRALALMRMRNGRRTPPAIQRMLADDLLAAVFPDQAACAENLAGEVRIPEHPLVDETIENGLREFMDLDGLVEVLEGIRDGRIRTAARDNAEASPFAAEILNASPFAFLDPAPLEERRSRAVRMSRSLPAELDQEAKLAPEAIAQAAEEAAPLVRDAEELHDALLTAGALPEREDWRPWFEELEASGRAAVLETPGRKRFLVAAERAALARALWPGGIFSRELPELPDEPPLPDSRAGRAAALLRGVLDSSGPVEAGGLAASLDVPEATVEAGLAVLEAEGLALRGVFRQGGALEWCHRRVLARIHRLTLAHLRRESAPVSAVRFMAFLTRWQHAAPVARLFGPGGVREAIEQLQGMEAPAAAWERDILPLRVTGYRRDWLDGACLSGAVVWGRIRPPDPNDRPPARPTRAVPIALLPRERLGDWRSATGEGEPRLSSAARKVRERLREGGASFFADLLERSGLLPAALEEALWELVAAGAVTADGFDNLRALINPRRRSGQGRHRRARARYGAGRWALLRGSGAGGASDEDLARRLLDRWGVVFRDLMKRERLESRWRALQLALRRLEMRGEVYGGRFVSAFGGEQFALPRAVRELRRHAEGDVPPLRIAAADPLNLSGILFPGPRIPTSASASLVIAEGRLTSAVSSP